MDTSIRLTDSSVNGHIELVPALATLQTPSSLSFSSDLVRLVDARAPLPSRAFSHERGHLRLGRFAPRTSYFTDTYCRSQKCSS